MVGGRTCSAAARSPSLTEGATLDVCEAAAVGDTDRLRALLASRPELANAHGVDGMTPLHLAASRGDGVLSEQFLALGARHTRTDDGRTPAELAEERGYPALAERLRGTPA